MRYRVVSARRAACQTPPPEEQLGKLRASNGQERKGQRSRVLICSRRGFSDGLYFLRRALVSCDEEMTDGGMKRLTIAMISHVAARFPSVLAVLFHIRDNAKEVRTPSSVQSCRKSRRLSFPNGVVEMRPVASLRAGPGKPARESSASAHARARDKTTATSTTTPPTTTRRSKKAEKKSDSSALGPTLAHILERQTQHRPTPRQRIPQRVVQLPDARCAGGF